MSDFDHFVQLQKQLLYSQINVIHNYLKKRALGDDSRKRTSNLDIVEDILLSAKKPLHISEILDIARNDYNVIFDRDSIVSAIIKKIKAGKRFLRTAPNTFGLR